MYEILEDLVTSMVIKSAYFKPLGENLPIPTPGGVVPICPICNGSVITGDGLIHVANEWRGRGRFAPAITE